MKIQCERQNLSDALMITSRAVPNRTPMPILECIVIRTGERQIELLSNDTKLAIESRVDGLIDEIGSIAVNARVFIEIVRKLPDGTVHIKTDDHNVMTIDCHDSHFRILGLGAEEFPRFPKVRRDHSITISEFTLRDMIRQTVFSVSELDSNLIMTGELFEINGDSLRMVSLDGHRISIRRTRLRESYPSNEVIIPGKTLLEVSRILTGEMDEDVTIYFTDKHIVFEFDQTMVVSSLIEGKFYKIDSMLSDNYETKVTLNRQQFLDCMERASLLTKETDRKPVILQIEDSKMNLKLNSAIGAMNDRLFIQQEGKDITIGFNPRFFTDVLRVIDDETVDLYLFSPKSPCFIKNREESYIYLILPVNIKAAV